MHPCARACGARSRDPVPPLGAAECPTLRTDAVRPLPRRPHARLRPGHAAPADARRRAAADGPGQRHPRGLREHLHPAHRRPGGRLLRQGLRRARRRGRLPVRGGARRRRRPPRGGDHPAAGVRRPPRALRDRLHLVRPRAPPRRHQPPLQGAAARPRLRPSGDPAGAVHDRRRQRRLAPLRRAPGRRARGDAAPAPRSPTTARCATRSSTRSSSTSGGGRGWRSRWGEGARPRRVAHGHVRASRTRWAARRRTRHAAPREAVVRRLLPVEPPPRAAPAHLRRPRPSQDAVRPPAVPGDHGRQGARRASTSATRSASTCSRRRTPSPRTHARSTGARCHARTRARPPTAAAASSSSATMPIRTRGSRPTEDGLDAPYVRPEHAPPDQVTEVCLRWVRHRYGWGHGTTHEHQYRHITPRVLVEELLRRPDGALPRRLQPLRVPRSLRADHGEHRSL